MKASNTFLALSLTTLLSACGGDGNTDVGTLNLAVSDNPADAKVVNIAFKQVVLKGNSGSYSFDVSEDDGGYRNVDLVTFSGLKVAGLVTDESIAVGEYQLCIYMQNNVQENNTASSYVMDPDDNIVGLTTPSEGACGGGVGADDADTGRLFINKKFTISEGENSYIAEFDLNKVLKEPTGQDTFWTLKPTGIELIEAGAIAGTVSQQLAMDCGNELGHSVYLYPGNVVLDNMSDIRDAQVILPQVAPISRVEATLVNSENEEEGYKFEFPAVYGGTYSLGYTCMANNDDPDATNVPDEFIIYTAQQNISVTVGETTAVDFVAEAP
ncbi:MAG TPA: DUF4382 domain-containing protein [Psychromonas sp.]